jgi:Tol biopolymer transport system component
VQSVILGGGLTILELDGSGARVVPVPIQPFDVGPAWAPDLQSLAVVGNGLLFNVSLAGTATKLTPDYASYGPVQGVDYAPDGQWIYFSAPTCNNANSALFKVAPNDSTAIRLSPPLADAWTECTSLMAGYPSVSPDGTRLVFENDSVTPSVLQVFTLASGAITPLGVEGSRPRWSPSGTRIAYTAADRVWVMNADGSGSQVVSPAGVTFAPGVAWSPDGSWLLVRQALPPYTSTQVALLSVTTGQLIPLRYSAGYYAYALPSWRAGGPSITAGRTDVDRAARYRGAEVLRVGISTRRRLTPGVQQSP